MDLVARAWRSIFAVMFATAASANPTHYCGTQQWQSLIAEAAERFSLPSSWLHAVMRAESAGCVLLNGQPTTSTAGAMGLMQLMPATWGEYRARLSLGNDPHEPRDNILAGAAYLRDLYDAYGEPGLFAAYHAGPGRYDDHLTSGRPLPRATLDYLARVREPRAPVEHASRPETEARSVFVTRERGSVMRATASSERPAHHVFVQLSSSTSRIDRESPERPDVQDE